MLETARPQQSDDRQDSEHTAGSAFRWHFGDFCPTEAWSPPINVYQLPRRIDVCMALAGVERQAVDVRVETGRLTIRGLRESPQPKRNGDESLRIIEMEIEHGAFCREVPIPVDVDLSRVTSEYVEGMLWIHLPLRVQG